MTHVNYWIAPNGEVQPIQVSHIEFIVNNLSMFNQSASSIQEYYDKYSEEFGTEVKASEEIISKIIVDGWISCLYNHIDEKWLIDMWKEDFKTSTNLRKWLLVLKKYCDMYNVKLYNIDLNVRNYYDKEVVSSRQFSCTIDGIEELVRCWCIIQDDSVSINLQEGYSEHLATILTLAF